MTTGIVHCLIIGIDGWEKYTKPLLESILLHEEKAYAVIIDNASQTPYPEKRQDLQRWDLHRSDERLSYSQAINMACELSGPASWYMVLSNDVICTGPFTDQLFRYPDDIQGPLLKENMGWQYLEGWCVACPGRYWGSGWDENFVVSSWEDVDFSVSKMKEGVVVRQMNLPFIHLDQKQRFTLIQNYWSSEYHNYQYFCQKHGKMMQ